MGQQWDADIALDAAAAAALIAAQFPALAPVALTTLGVGWDNVAFLTNERVVFRFPRRQIAAGLLEREARILPLLASHLPAPIPAPQYVGTPTPTYPFVFAGYPLLPGRTADERPPTLAGRAALAGELAAFLRTLHTVPLDAATRAWAPGDEITRADMQRRAPQLIARLTANAAGLAADRIARLCATVTELATTPAAPATCWVHGDLYARHLLLDGADHLAGVIDWGDIHLGDPALDLSIAWTFLPRPARALFRARYGLADDAAWRRARFRAIHYGATLSEYGASVGDEAIRTLGLTALDLAGDEG